MTAFSDLQLYFELEHTIAFHVKTQKSLMAVQHLGGMAVQERESLTAVQDLRHFFPQCFLFVFWCILYIGFDVLGFSVLVLLCWASVLLHCTWTSGKLRIDIVDFLEEQWSDIVWYSILDCMCFCCHKVHQIIYSYIDIWKAAYWRLGTWAGGSWADIQFGAGRANQVPWQDLA